MPLRSAVVTGGTGFIGSALVRRLVADGVRVLCPVRDKPTGDAPLALLRDAEVVRLSSFHTAELERYLREFSADVIFNLASYGVRPEDRDPEALLEGNAGLVARLVSAAAGVPPRRIIHAGSCSEYGAPPSSEIALTEAQPLQPESVYGGAKAAAELYGNALASSLAVPFVTLRLFGVFGIGEGPLRLIPYLINHLKVDEPVDLTPGEQVRDFLYLDDVVEAFVAAALEDGLTPYTAYNICSGKPVRIREVGALVADVMQKPHSLLQWGKRPYRRDEAMRIVGDNRRFTQATAWRPRVSLLGGVRRMVIAATDKRSRRDAQPA